MTCDTFHYIYYTHKTSENSASFMNCKNSCRNLGQVEEPTDQILPPYYRQWNYFDGYYNVLCMLLSSRMRDTASLMASSVGRYRRCIAAGISRSIPWADQSTPLSPYLLIALSTWLPWQPRAASATKSRARQRLLNVEWNVHQPLSTPSATNKSTNGCT